MVLEGGPRERMKNGYLLFRDEFIGTGKKFRNLSEQSKEAAKAWKELSLEERNKYREKVVQSRPEKKRKKKKVAFNTRCSLPQLKSLVELVKKDKELRGRAKSLGFSDLLDVGTNRLPRDLLISLIRSYDPLTHQFRIRRRTDEIEAKDVEQLLSVPHKGEEVRVDVDDNDETYKRLKSEYGKVPYTKILDDIKSGQCKDKFEFLFVLYTLGFFWLPLQA